jgi:hypothetical protein
MVSGLSRPVSFQLLLRSPADLVLIELPSWWTPRHIMWLLGAVTGVLLLAVAGVMLVARMRLKEQAVRRAMAEAEFSAILKERNRLAGEVHDTLAQGLGAISMQLELVKDRMKSGPETMIKHIELAHSLVRHSLRRCVMRFGTGVRRFWKMAIWRPLWNIFWFIREDSVCFSRIAANVSAFLTSLAICTRS